MSDTTMTDDDGRQTAERRDERAKWTRDIAEIFRGMTASPDYGAYRIAADFLDPPLAAPTSPSEPVPSTPRVPGSTERPEGILAVRQEWRVSGVADDKVYGKDHYWERIYEERARVDEHVDWLSRAYPEATAQVHRRTITTFTGEWMEETNDAD